MSRVDLTMLDLADKLRSDLEKALAKRAEMQDKLSDMNNEIHSLMADLDEVKQVIIERRITDARAQLYLLTETETPDTLGT